MKNRNFLQVFFAVQKALFLREFSMRFSVGQLGLFWTFAQPFFYVSLFVVIKVFIFKSASDNFDFAVFITLSFVAFHLFQNIIVKSIGSFSANKGLFLYKQVKPIDTIFARLLVEVFIFCVIVILFICIGFYFGYDMNVKNLGMIIFGYLWLMIFTFSIGLSLALASIYMTSIKNIISITMTLLMFASAIFYRIDTLSPELQHILLYNPLVHFMEMLHGYYFYALDDRYVDYEYMFLWTIGPLFPALWSYIKLEHRIISL